MLVVRMHLWKSFRCYAYECRVPLLEVVRIGEARHVYSWGNPDGVNPNENVCHASSGDVCHVLSEGGVPTLHIRMNLHGLAFSDGSLPRKIYCHHLRMLGATLEDISQQCQHLCVSKSHMKTWNSKWLNNLNET